MILAAYGLLVLAAALFFVRLLRGPSLADRVMAIDGLIICGTSTVVVNAVDTGRGTFLPIVVVFTLVGFIGTSVIARFIEAQGG
jgi:multicomponent Na+:H+ antiporter subunit F